MRVIKKDIDKVSDKVAESKTITPTLVYRDKWGNALYLRYIKTRGTLQFIGKGANGKLHDEVGVAILLRDAGYYTNRPGRTTKAVSAKGKRLMKLAGVI